jgi:hypothetical protein
VTTAAGEWCVRCCHMIWWCGNRWLHVSGDDWDGPLCECACTLQHTPCRPPDATVPDDTWADRGLRSLAQAVGQLRYTLENSAHSYTGLAEAMKREDEP